MNHNEPVKQYLSGVGVCFAENMRQIYGRYIIRRTSLMADIKKVDVETYVRLLISERLGYEEDVCNDSGLKKQTDKNERKLTRKQPSRLEDER